MQVYSVSIDEFSNNDYTLIAIHTALKDYRLAFLLNQYLQIMFKRSKNDLDFDSKVNKSSYSLYEYTNIKLDSYWFLIANVFITKSDFIGLFNEGESKKYLIPEKKKVDYFIKLEGNFSANFIKKTIEKINQIPQIITSYTIEPNTLKSKEFLIF